MNDCIKYAVEHSIKSIRSSSDLDNKSQQYINSIAEHFPSIGATINAGSNFGRGIDPATNSYINTATFSNGVGANLGWSVFNGLSLINRTRNAKFAKIKGQYDVELNIDKVAEEAMVAFAEVVYNKELVWLSEQRVEAYSTDLKRMERKAELGTGSMADVAQLAAKLAAEEYTLIYRKNVSDVSVIKLKDVMNYPLEEELTIEPNIEKREVFDQNQDVNEMMDKAFEFLPKSLSEKKALQISKVDLQIAQGLYSPSISLSAGLSTSYFTRLDGTGTAALPYGEQFKNNVGEYLSASLSIPIFNNLSYRTNVHIAKNNYKLAQANYKQAIRELSSEIEQVVLDVKSTQSQYEQAIKNVEAQKLANKANRQKYEHGLLGIIELQTSDNEYFQSQIEFRNSYLRYQIKVRQLNYYKGVPYIN